MGIRQSRVVAAEFRGIAALVLGVTALFALAPTAGCA